jgi:hypothetical protein
MGRVRAAALNIPKSLYNAVRKILQEADPWGEAAKVLVHFHAALAEVLLPAEVSVRRSEAKLALSLQSVLSAGRAPGREDGLCR